MGRIKELIKSFIEPAQEEKSFDELAVAAGIGEADLNMLKKSIGGVNWKFAEEETRTKNGRKNKIAPKESPVQEAKRIMRTNDLGRDRD